MSNVLRYLSRLAAYLIVFLLSAVWAVAALDSLRRPFFDIGRPVVGDAIISLATYLSLTPQYTLLFALLIVCLKLMVGAFLLATLFCAAYEKFRWGQSDDAMLDVALLIAAFASIAAAVPGLLNGGDMLNEVVGELMLCVIASALAIYGRGYVTKDELPPLERPQPVIIKATPAE